MAEKGRSGAEIKEAPVYFKIARLWAAYKMEIAALGSS
jgi:hypothetical protein